jgi:hypothetical protein
MKIPIVTLLLFGICLFYFSCYTEIGKEWSWQLVRRNPIQKMLFQTKERYVKFLSFFGALAIVMYAVGAILVILYG